jgi:hypothetical protein
MSDIAHQLYLYNPVGSLLTILPDSAFAGLEYGLKENQVGLLDLTLPPDFDISFLPIDGIIEIYRSVGGGAMKLEGETAWFIRKPAFPTDKDGVSSITVRAHSACDILDRRIVASYAGTSYTEKVSIPWDDLLREFVDENFGAGAADATRDLSPWLTIEADTSTGAVVTRSAAWREVLKTLQDIIAEVKGSGTYAAFDVVRTAPATFEFRVFIGARGMDHSATSANPVIVSQERHNLSQPQLSFDWESEHNFIYSLGQGQGSDRVLQTASDAARIGISPFNRQEFLRDARQTELAASVLAEANSALEQSRPKINFTGYITQTEGSLYGVHWNWGDIVTAEYKGLSFDCHVEAVTVSVLDNGTELAQGFLRSTNDIG